MNRSAVIVLLVGFVATSLAAEGEKPKATTVKVPGGATFEITPPGGWDMETIHPDGTLAPKVSLSTADHEATLATLQFGFTLEKNGGLAAKGKLEVALKGIARSFVEGSVEKKLTIEKLDSKVGTCLFTEVTNPDLLNKLTHSGYYKVVGIGLIASDETVVTVTLLGVSLTDKSYLAGKEIIKTGIKARK